MTEHFPVESSTCIDIIPIPLGLVVNSHLQTRPTKIARAIGTPS